MRRAKLNPAAAGLLWAGLTTWAAAADEPRPVRGPEARAPAPGAAASALIRSIREQESWIDRVRSLSLKAEVVHETTPAGIARRRRELEKQGRGGDDLGKSRGLRPRSAHAVEFAFDRDRVRSWDDWDPDWFDLRVWDGKRLIVHASYDTPPDRREYRISDKLSTMSTGTLGYFGFRAGPHTFWWDDRPEDREVVARLMGRPEDFTYGGRDTFHGTECHVVSRWANWTTFYIGVDDERLRGVREGARTVPEKRLVNWLNRQGHAFKNTEELRAWIKSRTPEEAKALEREESANLPRLVDPCWEYRLSDYREVAPGCWLPMNQARDLYCQDEHGRLAVEETLRVRITEATVNAPLPDAMFRVEIPEGAKVVDRTKKPPGVRAPHDRAGHTREGEVTREDDATRKGEATREGEAPSEPDPPPGSPGGSASLLEAPACGGAGSPGGSPEQ